MTKSTNHARFFWLSLAGVGLLASSCELIATPDRSKIPSENPAAGSGGSGGTPSGPGGAGGSGGGGGEVPCSTPSDCPEPTNECEVRTCNDKVCGTKLVDAGTPSKNQTLGDCKKVVCNDIGIATSMNDDQDVPVDGQECTQDLCNDGTPSNPPLPEMTPCGLGGALQCDATGSCVGCTEAEQCGTANACSTWVCDDSRCGVIFTPDGTPTEMQTEGDCLSAQCDGAGNVKTVPLDSDIIPDALECTLDECSRGVPTHPNVQEGTACTGGKCNGQGACVECLVGGDCPAGVCVANQCASAQCTDKVKNGTETDVDCGGGDCPPCEDGDACALAGDCQSGVCAGNVCAAPTCGDGVKNGLETDVDCGNTCPPCGPGKSCSVGADCVGGMCTGNTCVPTCTDNVMNGNETDVDCGGSCGHCALGDGCLSGADCASAVCSAGGVCVECNGAGDCPPTGNECVAPACSSNACGTVNLDSTHAVAGQTPGDCQKLVCNGGGGVVSVDDVSDLPISNSVCLTSPACAGSPAAPSFVEASPGTDCTGDNQPPAKVCGDGAAAGSCVECNSDEDCTAPATCSNHTCS